MKNILQVPAHLYIGGVEKVARDIGMYADQEKYHVDYIVFDKETGDYELELLEKGCRVFRMQEPSEDYRLFIKELKRIMTETKYDVVHAHTMFNIGLIMLVAKLEKVPIRVSHAHSALDTDGGFVTKCYEMLMRLLILMNATDLIACGEKAGCRLYSDKVFQKSGKLILNGIDIKKYAFSIKNRERMRNQLGLEDKYVIGHAGHLLEVKNQRFLIGLMPELLKANPNARLLLLGEGSDREMLEGLIQENHLQEYVKMTGNVSNVNEYLSAMDVFAFPSLYEGMPLSLIEVQANGLPCVISTGVPKDVHLTDLVQAIDLENRDLWLESIINAERKNSVKYTEILLKSGFDTSTAMEKIFSIYER